MNTDGHGWSPAGQGGLNPMRRRQFLGGAVAEKVAWDREAAPFACHTHVAWKITEGDLVGRLTPFWDAGYAGYYSVEHHSGENEYREVAIQFSRVSEALEKLGAEK